MTCPVTFNQTDIQLSPQFKPQGNRLKMLAVPKSDSNKKVEIKGSLTSNLLWSKDDQILQIIEFKEGTSKKSLSKTKEVVL